jgi:hypothetical protein
MFERRYKIDPDWEAGVKSYQSAVPFKPVPIDSGKRQMLLDDGSVFFRLEHLDKRAKKGTFGGDSGFLGRFVGCGYQANRLLFYSCEFTLNQAISILWL